MTTTIATVREAVYERFTTMWSSFAPYSFDNEAFDPPASLWVRLSVRHLTSSQFSLGAIGNRRFERTAAIVLQIFDLENAGVANSDAAVQKFRDIFEGVSLPGIDAQVYQVSVREIGPLEGNHQTNVQAQLRYIEVR